MSHFSRTAQKFICQLELFAVVLANLTFRELLSGQQVIYFEDNTPALSSLIHGYSSKEDMAHLANMYHLLNFAMEVDAWHEWVPSSANIADVPSRPRFKTNSPSGDRVDSWQPLIDIGAERTRMIFPSQEEFFNLNTWWQSVCQV